VFGITTGKGNSFAAQITMFQFHENISETLKTVTDGSTSKYTPNWLTA
jgi:hypothetical protein